MNQLETPHHHPQNPLRLYSPLRFSNVPLLYPGRGLPNHNVRNMAGTGRKKLGFSPKRLRPHAGDQLNSQDSKLQLRMDPTISLSFLQGLQPLS